MPCRKPPPRVFFLHSLLPVVLCSAGSMTFGNYAYLHLSVAFISILKASGLGSHQECKHRVLRLSPQCARDAWACLHLWVAFLSFSNVARAGSGYVRLRRCLSAKGAIQQIVASQTQILILLQEASSCKAVWLPVLMQSCRAALLCLRCSPHTVGPLLQAVHLAFELAPQS